MALPALLLCSGPRPTARLGGRRAWRNTTAVAGCTAAEVDGEECAEPTPQGRQRQQSSAAVSAGPDSEPLVEVFVPSTVTLRGGGSGSFSTAEAAAVRRGRPPGPRAPGSNNVVPATFSRPKARVLVLKASSRPGAPHRRSHSTWGSAAGRSAQAAAPLLARAEEHAGGGEEAATDVLMAALTPDTLLSARQERQLAALLQRLRALEGVREDWESARGRQPSVAEWARAAGISRWDLVAARHLGSQALEHLVSCNVRLVVAVAVQYRGQGVDLQDLVSEGTAGLRRAAKQYNPSRNCRLSTYAHWWIRRYIQVAVSSQSRTVRLPITFKHDMAKMLRAAAELRSQLGRQASQAEVAARCGMSQVRLAYLRKFMPSPIPWDTVVEGLDGEGERADTPAWVLRRLQALEEDDQGSASIGSVCDLDRAISSLLTEQEAFVLRLRYGLRDLQERSFREVGAAIQMSKQRAAQIEASAISKLRHKYQGRGLALTN